LSGNEGKNPRNYLARLVRKSQLSTFDSRTLQFHHYVLICAKGSRRIVDDQPVSHSALDFSRLSEMPPGRVPGRIVRVEIMKWVNFITVVCPLVGLIAILAFFAVFYRPLRQILEQFNCCDLIRLKLGPLEIEKRRSRKPVRTRRRKKM
jgi:hypothetical protein